MKCLSWHAVKYYLVWSAFSKVIGEKAKIYFFMAHSVYIIHPLGFNSFTVSIYCSSGRLVVRADGLCLQFCSWRIPRRWQWSDYRLVGARVFVDKLDVNRVRAADEVDLKLLLQPVLNPPHKK